MVKNITLRFDDTIFLEIESKKESMKKKLRNPMLSWENFLIESLKIK